MVQSIARNLFAGLRLLLPVHIRQKDFQASLTSASIALFLSLLSMAVFDYLRQDGEIGFSDYGAATIGSILFVVFFVSTIVARMQSDMPRLPLFLTALLSATPWYVTATYAFRNFAQFEPFFAIGGILILGWGISVLVRTVRLTFGVGSNAAAAVAVLFVFISIYVVNHRYLQTSLFYSYNPADYEPYAEIDVEDIYYSQPALVARKVEQLSKQRPKVSDTYFVGFAGNGDQSIFAREVLFAQQTVENQYDAGGRAISLFNDIEVLTEEPLANRHNLRATLEYVGELMDPDNDVLFLFLTSHGSRDATLDTSLYPLDMHDLSAEDLRRYLDESGILWRVVVVSACYSGSFIDALRNDQTIVISASADDRNSFGCSDDRDLTYFGEEFFAKQLAHNDNLVEAFESAAKSINAKELERGLTPSEPQIYVGPMIREKLAEQVP